MLPFSFVSYAPDLLYNGSSLNCSSPRNIIMSTSRSSPTPLHLTLDEQSFQGLLSAAFTIQEHNDRRHQEQELRQQEHNDRSYQEQTLQVYPPDEPHDFQVELAEQNEPQRQTQPQQMKRTEEPAHADAEAPAASPPETELSAVCPHCGAQKPSDGSTCKECGLGQFRPGERLQRNWASMWLRSQQQGLWPERSPEADESQPKVRPGTTTPVAPPLAANRPPRLPSAHVPDTHADARLVLGRANGHEPTGHPAFASALNHPSSRGEITSESISRAPQVFGSSALDDFLPAEVAPFNAAPSDTLSDPTLDPVAGDPVADLKASEAAPRSPMQRLAELSVTVRFHRADLYLGIAVFVAALALLWPTAASPRRAALGPWERLLVTLGVAEAPAPPVVHLQGDPGTQVWIDTHSALYYCPGEEQFGKTVDGHFTTQREAQMDRFQPAGQSVCD